MVFVNFKFLIVTLLFIMNRFPFPFPLIVVFSPIIDSDLLMVIGMKLSDAFNSVLSIFIVSLSFVVSIISLSESNESSVLVK